MVISFLRSFKSAHTTLQIFFKPVPKQDLLLYKWFPKSSLSYEKYSTNLDFYKFSNVNQFLRLSVDLQNVSYKKIKTVPMLDFQKCTKASQKTNDNSF